MKYETTNNGILERDGNPTSCDIISNYFTFYGYTLIS